MQIPVAVEPTVSGQFRAHSFPPFTAVAEGKTSDEAVLKLRQELSKEIETGKRLVMLDVPADEENPWPAMSGWLKDDPLFDDWRAEVEAYRHQCDIEAGIDLPERS